MRDMMQLIYNVMCTAHKKSFGFSK